MVGEAGIEPTTPGLEGRCSIQLSYSPGFFHFSFKAEMGETCRKASGKAADAERQPAACPVKGKRKRRTVASAQWISLPRSRER